MPPEETSRCHSHPGEDAVAACAECGKPVCLACAVPVRGSVIGVECLDVELSRPVAVKPRRVRAPLVGIGFAVAVVATLMPWRKYGLGSGLFGAWGTAVRWSVISAACAITGLLIWAWPTLRHRLLHRGAWIGSLRVLATTCVAGAAMHLIKPPIVGPQSYGAWVAIAGGLLALAGTWRAASPGD